MDETQEYRVEEEQGDSSKHGQVKEGLLKRLGNWLGNTKIGTGVKIGVLTGAFWGAGIVADYVFRDYHGSEAAAESSNTVGFRIALEDAIRRGDKIAEYGARMLYEKALMEDAKEEAKREMKDKTEEARRKIGSEHPDYAHVVWTGSSWRPESGYTWINPRDNDNFRVKKITDEDIQTRAEEEARMRAREETKENIRQGIGFKKVRRGLFNNVALISCNEIGDFNGDGSLLYSEECRGVKSLFTLMEDITLYCGGRKSLPDWGIEITNARGTSVYKAKAKNNGYGLDIKFKGKDFGVGDFTTTFFQGDKPIGSLKFRVTN